MRKEECHSEFTVDRRTVLKIMDSMAEKEEILIVRRHIAISKVGQNQAEIDEEVENANLREATFYIAPDCDENTLGTETEMHHNLWSISFFHSRIKIGGQVGAYRG